MLCITFTCQIIVITLCKSRYLSILAHKIHTLKCRQDLDHVVTDVLFHLAGGQGFFGRLLDVEDFMESIGNLWLYIAFFGIVTVMLLIDFLGFKQKRRSKVKIKTAALWSIAWVSVASLFGCRSLAVQQAGHCGQYQGHGVFLQLFT
jgi:hypothetical protein